MLIIFFVIGLALLIGDIIWAKKSNESFGSFLTIIFAGIILCGVSIAFLICGIKVSQDRVIDDKIQVCVGTRDYKGFARLCGTCKMSKKTKT